MTCTTDELLQVMQKLLCERQKVKALERKLGTPSTLTKTIGEEPVVITSKEDGKEIQLLKTRIKDLEEQIQAAHTENEALLKQKKESSAPQEPADVAALKQNLYQAQREIRSAKERSSELEEELKRLTQFRASLQIELKEQTAKAHDSEKLKADVLAYKNKISDLEAKLANAGKSSQPHEGSFVSKESWLVERQKREELELFVEDQKLIFVDLVTKIKELEKKSEALFQEKQKLEIQKQKYEEALSSEKSTHTTLLLEFEKNLPLIATYQQEKAQYLDQFSKTEKKLLQKEREYEELATRAAHIEKNLEVLQNERQSLLDLVSSHKYELEKARRELEHTLDALQQKESIIENHEKALTELEEHLLHRIDQCTTLTEENESLKQELISTKASLQAVEQDLITKETALVEEIAHFEAYLNDALSSNEHLEKQLKEAQSKMDFLNAVHARYKTLEEMIKKSYELITK